MFICRNIYRHVYIHGLVWAHVFFTLLLKGPERNDTAPNLGLDL